VVPVEASLVVTEVDVAAPVVAAVSAVVLGAAASAVVLGVVVAVWPAGCVGSCAGVVVPEALVSGVVVCAGWAKAAPVIRAEAATAVRMMLSFMRWVSCFRC
jgi:hypothetical protein